jgi:hypothetical protein
MGKQKWTKIEETAIRNRGYEHGYDFVLLIPTCTPVIPPRWLPKSRLWLDLDRWGIESAASVIAVRVQEFGGELKEETLAEKMERIEKERMQRQENQALLNSQEGLELGLKEVEALSVRIQLQIAEIKNKASRLNVIVRQNRHNLVDVLSYGYYLSFQFSSIYFNSLEDSFLYAVLYKGSADEFGNDQYLNGKKLQLLAMTKYRFEIDILNGYGWLDDKTKKFISSAKLGETWLEIFFNYVTKERSER